jgi:hypothetical protein
MVNALLATKSIEHVQPVASDRARAIPSPFILSAYYTKRQAVGRRYGAVTPMSVSSKVVAAALPCPLMVVRSGHSKSFGSLPSAFAIAQG